MALSNSKPHLALAIITCSLLLLSKMKSSESVSFNYPNFWSDLSDITFQGHANSTTGTLQLTKTDYDGNAIRSSAGQALYSEPVQLRDSNTGNLASFYTTFSFLLKTTASNPADGFAFFIAPTDSQVKDAGGCLGLFNLATATDTSKNQVVAVEFDTWINGEWQEPRYRHIGIDINSIESVATKRWQDSDVFSGSIATAHISYDASSKILTVILTYPNGEDYVLSHVVDLSDVLPEQVRVGFSGATGQYETKYILSWYFSSTGSTSSTLQSKSSNCKIFNRRCVI